MADQDFVTVKSLKNFGGATASLTVVINVITYVYRSAENKDMPPVLVLSVGLVLSLAYIFSFFKREVGLTLPQYAWITGLNSLTVFSSITGINSMLDHVNSAAGKPNASQTSGASLLRGSSMREASVGDFLYHVVIPTHSWFNTSEINRHTATHLVDSTIVNIDSTQQLLDMLITQRTLEIRKSDTLHQTIEALQTSNENLQKALAQTQTNLHSYETVLAARNIPHTAPVAVSATLPPAELTSVIKTAQQLQATWQSQKLSRTLELETMQRQQTQLSTRRQQLQLQAKAFQ